MLSQFDTKDHLEVQLNLTNLSWCTISEALACYYCQILVIFSQIKWYLKDPAQSLGG